MKSVILLSRRQKLHAAASQWNFPDTELFTFDSPAEALARINLGRVSVFLFDMRDYPRFRHVVRKFQSMNTDVDLILMGILDEDDIQLEAPEGILSVLPASADLDEVAQAVSRALQFRQVRLTSGIIGRSRAVRDMLALIAHSAPLDVSVLILGESGTGKEMVAQAIHQNSSRSKGPFVSLNCGAISPGVLESELFGHVRGAFTGAVKDNPGVFKRADKGTLFLDEVAEMPLEMQTRFLRALETGEFIPVGGRTTEHSDIRLVAATHRDLAIAVARGKFRQDLYYRLRVVVINTPALRERRDDIMVLAEAFLMQENDRHHLHVRGFTRAAEQALQDHSWPGNVRELKNAISSAVVLKQRGLIDSGDLPSDIMAQGEAGMASGFLPIPLEFTHSQDLDPGLLATALLELRQDIREIRGMLMKAGLGPANPHGWSGEGRNGLVSNGRVVETFSDHAGYSPLAVDQGGDLQTAERALIESALRACGGNRRQAAARLGISERTLYRKLKLYGLS